MSDAVIPAAFDKRNAPHRNEVETFQNRELRRLRRVRTASIGLNVALVGLLALNAVGVYELLPLVRTVPFFIPVHSNGYTPPPMPVPVDSELPTAMSEAQIEATLWTYVQYRESYDFPGSRYAYDIVSSMSAPDVRNAYQQWANYKNKESPVHLLGKDGTIRIQFVAAKLDQKDHTYTCDFYREVDQDGQPPSRGVWRVTVQYADSFAVPYQQRVTYNPTSLLVTGYSSPKPLGMPTPIKTEMPQ